MSRTSPSLIATAPTVARSHPRGSMVAAIVALAVAAVLAIALIGAGSEGSSGGKASQAPVPSKAGVVGHPAFGRGPNAAAVTPSRADGGPDESGRAPLVFPPSRPDGGPEEGSWKPGH